MHDRASSVDIPVEKASKAAFNVAHVARLSIVLIPVLLWIWLCRDWPARLGFYSDDWMILLNPFVGTADAFHRTLGLVATRPVSAPYIWLAQLIIDWSPARSQLLNAAMLLVCAASMAMLAAAVISAVRGLRNGILVGASLAGATFIVFPSTVGTFAWGVGVTTAIPALPLFCLAITILLHARDWRWLGAGLALAALSHLSYEAFYFQEITFILLAATLRGTTTRKIPWRLLAAVVVVNVACVVFNRLTSGGVQKSFHWNFLQIFAGGYSKILATLGHATREFRFLVAATVLVAGPAGAICLARFIGASRVYLGLLVTICGVIASGFLYASAGYGLIAEGPLARTCIVIATFYSVTAGVLAAAAWCGSGRNRFPAIAFCLAAITGLVALEQAARARVSEWAETWSYELARLSRLPATIKAGDIPAGSERRLYLAVEYTAPLIIDPASAPWEVIGAVAWEVYNTTHSRLLMVDRWTGTSTAPQWLATPRHWFNRWDGRSLDQGPCGSAVFYSTPGSELWIWNTSASALNKVEAPWQYGCDEQAR